MELTAKQVYCLRRLRAGESTGGDIANMARDDGINRTRLRYEWADAPLRELRERGLVEYTGQKEMAAHIYRITDAGRAAIAEIEGKA